MYLPKNPGSKPNSSPNSSCNKKIKFHVPADPVGKRYVKYFYYPRGAIVAPATSTEEKPAWLTRKHYLHASTLWSLHQDDEKLVGIRFGNTTNFGVIDLDEGGEYHNLESVQQIQYALEAIGIADTVPIQSSYSGGYHLIIPLAAQLPTFSLACALEKALKKAGFNIRQGHLEVFPNAKLYGTKTVTSYKAIRCPMQPRSGALLLNKDLEPISDSVEIFLDHCDHAASRQDLTKLKRFATRARKQITKERYKKTFSKNALEWRTEWEEIIATGWTGKGQTNTYLQVLVGYGIVFLELEYEEVVKYALEVATNAPGYTEYCGHQHEIEARVRQWVACSINNKWFSKYPSYPERPLETFAATFSEAMTPREFALRVASQREGIAGGRNEKQEGTRGLPQNSSFPVSSSFTPDNVIPFDRRKAICSQRSREAQRRIRWSVKALEWGTGLPSGITDRARAISAEYKLRFGKTLSQETLRKYLHLWHPKFYVEDPWAENSSNSYQIRKYGHFEQKIQVDQNKNAQNPCYISKYGHSSYMKVFCLPPYDAAPQGQSSAPEVFDSTENQETETLELENSEVEDSENVNCFNNSDDELNYELNSKVEDSEIENLPVEIENVNFLNNLNNLNNFNNNSDSSNNLNNSNNSLESLNYLQSTENTSDKHSKYPSNCGDPEKSDNQNLSIVEIKQATRLRLKAISEAKKVVRRYCVMTGTLLRGKERRRLEEIAKYQLYLDSECSVLVAEAEAWAVVNPGCLPFRLESAFNEHADE